MSDALEAQRGQLAEQVLRNAVYVDAYGLIESELTRLWRESRDRDEREQLHQLLKMLTKVQTVLESTMRTGQVATAELQRKQTLAQKIGSRLQRD